MQITEFIKRNWNGENRWRRSELNEIATELNMTLDSSNSNEKLYNRIQSHLITEPYMIDLKIKGYCIIKNVIEANIIKNDILDWISKVKVPYATHGVIKHYQVGHQPFQWYTRCQESVQNPFKKIYNTNELVVSFDGIGYVPAGIVRRDNFWMHTDQAPNNSNFISVQGLVALTSNSINTFKCIPGSHLYHKKYFENKTVDKNKLGKNWFKLDSPKDYSLHTEQIYKEEIVALEKGNMLLWDSRLFHQNQQGGDEERLVQYVTYRPKSGRSDTQKKKREKYFKEKRTTSHWAYPVTVNSNQPQTFGDTSKLINYDILPKINLEDYNINDLI